MPILTCKNISKTYPGAESVINDISLELEESCFVSIMGRSGAGKSTLLRLMCGLILPDSGEIITANYNLCTLKGKDLYHFRSSVIGIVFQDGNLIEDFSVADNILSPLYISGQKIDKAYFDKLIRLTDTAGFLTQKPSTLSGGQRQRAAIARALIARPKIIFADEPTGSLDKAGEEKIMQLFSDINKELNVSIVQATHSQFCAAVGSKIITIDDGKIIAL